MTRQPRFVLSKWYMDGVSEAGDVFLGYAANLRWKRLAMGYASVLEFGGETGVRTAVSLRRGKDPVRRDAMIDWESRPLGVSARWIGEQAPIERRLLEVPDGTIDWHCHLPRARVSFRRAGGATIEGLGYVEQLRMTLPPWKLPIEELRWGRFLSTSEALVWIEWRGPMPLTFASHNGRQAGDLVVADDRVLLDGGRVALTLEDRTVLREGPLVSTVLRETPLLNKLLPAPFLNTYERKWLSRGLLTCAGAASTQGWVIHETVRLRGDSGS